MTSKDAAPLTLRRMYVRIFGFFGFGGERFFAVRRVLLDNAAAAPASGSDRVDCVSSEEPRASLPEDADGVGGTDMEDAAVAGLPVLLLVMRSTCSRRCTLRIENRLLFRASSSNKPHFMRGFNDLMHLVLVNVAIQFIFNVVFIATCFEKICQECALEA